MKTQNLANKTHQTYHGLDNNTETHNIKKQLCDGYILHLHTYIASPHIAYSNLGMRR